MKILTTIIFAFLFSFCAFAQSATVMADKTESRGTHDPKGKTVEKLAKGAKVEVLKTFGDWFLVQSADYAGWVQSFSVTLDAPAEAAKPPVDETSPSQPSAPAKAPETKAPAKSSDGRTYLTGKRGGCYYLNGSGNKVYVDKSLCGN